MYLDILTVCVNCLSDCLGRLYGCVDSSFNWAEGKVFFCEVGPHCDPRTQAHCPIEGKVSLEINFANLLRRFLDKSGIISFWNYGIFRKNVSGNLVVVVQSIRDSNIWIISKKCEIIEK